MNLVVLTGNVGADAELKTVGENAVLEFRLATTETWKTKAGEKQEKTAWHSVSLWGTRASALAQHITKGKKLTVVGKIDYSTSGEGDAKKYFTRIKADNIEFVGGAKQTREPGDDSDLDADFG